MLPCFEQSKRFPDCRRSQRFFLNCSFLSFLLDLPFWKTPSVPPPFTDSLCKRCVQEKLQLCNACRIPLCRTCADCIVFNHTSEIPMVLANDNFWGYTSDLIFRYKVRWLEAAIVQPCWTSMLVCYVEGDYGHLMNEELQQQQFRTKVRGSAYSFHMPWEQILEELRQHCLGEELEPIPRKAECLKYILRVHLRIDKYSMEKVLRQLTVRPYVLLQLLYYLIDQNHAVFRGRGSAQQLRERMRAAVQREYPVSAEQMTRPDGEQEWFLPTDYIESLSEAATKKVKRHFLIKEKNATPGDGDISLEGCLADRRPFSVVTESSGLASTDPATLRANTLSLFGSTVNDDKTNRDRSQEAQIKDGKLVVQTGHSPIHQWEGKYFSQILPFVIPFMVSGPDFEFYQQKKRWRRRDVAGPNSAEFLPAPWVSASRFLAGFARRCESQCRQDWAALPIMRTVTFKYTVETAGSLFQAPFRRQHGRVMDTTATQIIQDAKALCHALWNGCQRFGNIRVPINGDTTRLPYADGLTSRQKQLAREIRYKAQHFEGTQGVRQIMGHRHWGARVSYGDCLFFTISPNEQHSALVLKLSRYRRNDPFLKHSDPAWTQLCGMEYPSLAAKRRKFNANTDIPDDPENSNTPLSSEDEVLIDLPAYDLRRLAAARDPLAVVEAHRINI